jgi:hypothetical protein
MTRKVVAEPDLNLRQHEKLDPDPHSSQMYEALEAKNLAVLGHGGSNWSPTSLVDQWSHLRIPLTRIRIRIQVESWIRKLIDVMRIRNLARISPLLQFGNTN